MIEIENEIISCSKLEEGWNFGSGSPASKEVVDKTLEIYWISKRFNLNCLIFPTVDGGIQISFYKGEDFMDFFVNPNLEVEFVHERGTGFYYNTITELKNIDRNQIIEKLISLGEIND